MKHMFNTAYVPRLDRCSKSSVIYILIFRLTVYVWTVPLFEVESLFHTESERESDSSNLNAAHTDKPIDRVKDALAKADIVADFCFQWIPLYRVYATGERFWQVLRLEDSQWSELVKQEEEERESEARKANRKAKL